MVGRNFLAEAVVAILVVRVVPVEVHLVVVRIVVAVRDVAIGRPLCPPPSKSPSDVFTTLWVMHSEVRLVIA